MRLFRDLESRLDTKPFKMLYSTVLSQPSFASKESDYLLTKKNKIKRIRSYMSIWLKKYKVILWLLKPIAHLQFAAVGYAVECKKNQPGGDNRDTSHRSFFRHVNRTKKCAYPHRFLLICSSSRIQSLVVVPLNRHKKVKKSQSVCFFFLPGKRRTFCV